MYLTISENLQPSSNPILEVQGLSYSASGELILDQVSLVIQESECVALFGPNGGGKTTLLNLFMGFLKPDRGTIKLWGHSLDKARSKIGWVPQHFRPDPFFPISVLEVVCLGLMHYKDRCRLAKEALSLVKMEKFAHAPFSSLSGGEAQRVLLARALAAHPSLLFLDEPTASLDPATQEAIYRLLEDLKKTTTLVMVTHDLKGAYMLADRFFLVERRVEEYAKQSLCHHFSQGLYHPGLTPKDPR